jgi:hypothetical protein
VASLCGAREAALFSDRQEILHLPQLDLYPHLINVSEKDGANYCFFEQIIAFKGNNRKTCANRCSCVT